MKSSSLLLKRVLFIVLIALHLSCKSQHENYVCPPCDMACDELTFAADGTCPHCNMNLIQYADEGAITDLKLTKGSGNFYVAGGKGNEENVIRVFYHLPKVVDSTTKVVVVLPGAGRNGDQYRDAWVGAAEAYNVLVLSLSYSEQYYPQFWNYNLAGMLTNVTLNNERTAMTDFEISQNKSEWIFNDFDRIFKLVKDDLQLTTETYDLFGHSAGGQIAHRLALFSSNHNAKRILAANSGWYTVPTDEEDFPVGLKNSGIRSKQINFTKKLVLFIGEKDNANETRGELRHTPELDKQGLHRLSRGRYFYRMATKMANESGSAFNWNLEIVPGIGHDYQKMSEAAADYLYRKPN